MDIPSPQPGAAPKSSDTAYPWHVHDSSEPNAVPAAIFTHQADAQRWVSQNGGTIRVCVDDSVRWRMDGPTIRRDNLIVGVTRG